MGRQGQKSGSRGRAGRGQRGRGGRASPSNFKHHDTSTASPGDHQGHIGNGKSYETNQASIYPSQRGGRTSVRRGRRGRGGHHGMGQTESHTIRPVQGGNPEDGGDDHEASLLQDNILDLTQHMQLTSPESTNRQTALQRVRNAAGRAFPQAVVEVFGSQAAGSAIHSSDMDLVVLNLAQPPAGGGGYPKEQRPRVASMLQKILKELRRQGSVVGRADLIRTARIPIIKCKTPEGVDCDIAIGDSSACVAAEWQRKMFVQWPKLKPLVICIKTLLRHHGLADVSIGGLSSFSVINMALAVLQTNPDKKDLGTLFVAFLKLFGKDFDYYGKAISVNRGGLVSRISVLRNGYNDDNLARQSHELRLTVEDPLTNRDISGGSYLMWQVKAAFFEAFQTLESIKSRGMSSWNGQSLLGRLMNLRSMISRKDYHYSAGQSYSGDNQQQQAAVVGSKRPAAESRSAGDSDGQEYGDRAAKAVRSMAPGSVSIIGTSKYPSRVATVGIMQTSRSDLFQQRLLAHAERIANEN